VAGIIASGFGHSWSKTLELEGGFVVFNSTGGCHLP
jgi:hypothetical protein